MLKLNRITSAVLTVLSILGGSSLAQAAAPLYHVTDLGIPAGFQGAEGNAINASGAVAGNAWGATGGGIAFLYANGALQSLGILPGGSTSVPTGINTNAAVVGQGDDSMGNTEGFLYSGGSMQGIGYLPGGNSSYLAGINTSGVAAGDATDIAGVDYPIVYSGGTITSLGIPFPGGSYGYAVGINDSGLVTGVGDISTGASHCFIYNGSSYKDIGTLPGGTDCSPAAINGSGLVIGSANTASRSWDPFLYNGSTMVDLGNPVGGTQTSVTGINSSGWVVGYGYPSGVPVASFVYDGTTSYDLSTVLDSSGTGWSDITAYGINDNGQITGYASFNGAYHAFILTPGSAPAPAAPPPPVPYSIPGPAATSASSSTAPSGSCYVFRVPLAGVTGPAVTCGGTTASAAPVITGDIRTESAATSSLLTTIPGAYLSQNLAIASATASGVYLSLDSVTGAAHPMLVEVSSGTAKDVLDLPANEPFFGLSTGGSGLPVAAYAGDTSSLTGYFVVNGVSGPGVNIMPGGRGTIFPVATSNGILAVGTYTPNGDSCAMVNIAAGTSSAGTPCNHYNNAITQSASGAVYTIADDGVLYQMKSSAYLGNTGVVGTGGHLYTASWAGPDTQQIAVDSNDAFLYYIDASTGDIYRMDLSQATTTATKIAAAPMPAPGANSAGLVWQAGGTAGGQLYEVGYSAPGTAVVYQIK